MFHQKFKPFYLALAILVLCSHDLYIKMDSYFFQPNQEVTLNLYNGTFEKSENTITRDRMMDASIVGQGNRTSINPEQWTDKDTTITQLAFNTGAAGTYVVGVATKPRNIALTAEKFNDYLRHDGVLDMLEKRTNDSLLGKDAVESYQKHVKAIYQVGAVKTNDWSTVLGYPIEFVPQANPYEKYNGETLDVQLLLDGKPLSNQLVYADYLKNAHSHKSSHGDEEHSEGHSHSDDHSHADSDHTHSHSEGDEDSHTHTEGQELRTNDKGMVTVDLPEEGIYYIRSIYMTNVADSDELTHQSKWATLTFEVSHKHDESTHTHDHEHEDGLPFWLLVIGSLVVIGVLFFAFRKKE